MAGHTFFRYSSTDDRIRRFKAPACPYAARAEFERRIKAMKSGALELVNDKGETLEEFAAPDEYWLFQGCGVKAIEERRAAMNGRPMPEPTVWRKSYRR
jgi:hypothetical protein